MAREIELRGLGNKTRRKVANRPFEDIQGVKNGIPVSNHSEAHDKLAEKNAAANTAKQNRIREDPPSRARLTIREKKRSLIRSSISLADE